MTTEPSHPSTFQDRLTIEAKCDINNTWTVTCWQWEAIIHTRNLTRDVAILLAEIENHNEACERRAGRCRT